MQQSKFHVPGIKFFYRNIYIIAITLAIACIGCQSKIKLAAVKYNAADIIALLNNPDSMNYLTLHYLSANGKTSTPLTLLSYARNATGGFLNVPVYNLQSVDTASSRTFEGKTILGNLVFSRDDIKTLLKDSITNKEIQKFDFLLFSPAIDPKGGYLYYLVTVEGIDPAFLSKEGRARPCPPAPNCPAHPTE